MSTSLLDNTDYLTELWTGTENTGHYSCTATGHSANWGVHTVSVCTMHSHSTTQRHIHHYEYWQH